MCVCGHEIHGGVLGRGRCTSALCGCQRLVPDTPEIRQRALAAADIPLTEALTAHDQRRRRSGKTRRARKAGRWGVGASDVGSCRAAIGFRENPPPGHVPLPEDKAAAALGTFIHDGHARLTRALYPWRQVKVRVLVPGFDEPSEADAYDPILGEVEDLKTAGDWMWERVNRMGAAMPDHIDQVMTYGFGLAAAGHVVKTVRVTYVERKSGRSESFVYDYDEVRALAAIDWLHAVLDTLDSGGELPRDRLGPSTDGLCRNCVHRITCWDMDAAEEAGRTPEGWMLARDDAGVEAALALYDSTREDAERKARHDHARALLDGVPTGTYGDYILKWSRPTLPDPEPDDSTRLALLEEHMARVVGGQDELMHPDLLPHPTRQPPSRKPSISVRRTPRRRG